MLKRLTATIGAMLLGVALLVAALGLVAVGGNPEVVEAGLWAQGHIFHTDAITNAPGTAMDVKGFPLVGVQVEGITTATITFEATTDGTNYDAIQVVNTGDGATATTTTADGQFWVAVGGKENLRCRISGYISGTIDVVGLGVTHSGPINLADSAMGSPTDGTYIGDINFGESLPAGTNTIGDVTISEFNETRDITVTLDSEVVSVDVTTGTVDIGEITSALPTGANTIGDVTVSSVTTGTITVDGSVTADTELTAIALADGATNPTVPRVGTAGLLYNNATWDRERGNYEMTAFASAMRTTSLWADMVNYNARGAYIFVRITGVEGGQTMQVYAEVDDDASSQAVTFWRATTALTTTGHWAYLIYPGAGAAAQEILETVSYPIPRNWDLGYILTNSENITFSIGVHYIN